MEPFVKVTDRLLALQSNGFQKQGLIAGFTTRIGGEGVPPYDTLNVAFHVGDEKETVIKNREKVARDLGLPLSNWVSAEQVHGDEIIEVNEDDKGKGAFAREEAVALVDGIYTKSPNVLLTSFYADCVPLYFVAPKEGVVGLAHAGWRGTAAGIASKMVNHWVNVEGIDVENIYVACGPAISGDVYEVDQVVIKAMQTLLPTEVLDQSKPWKEKERGKYLLDVREANRSLLITEGILPEHISLSSFCTYRDESLFFSFRRDEGQTGRMMSYIGQKETE